MTLPMKKDGDLGDPEPLLLDLLWYTPKECASSWSSASVRPSRSDFKKAYLGTYQLHSFHGNGFIFGRNILEDINLDSVAKFSEEKLLSLCAYRKALLYKPKTHAVVDNARQILKVQKLLVEIHEQSTNEERAPLCTSSTRQDPKGGADKQGSFASSGFRCVGPTVIFCCMHVSGMVNNHLTSCFRCEQCNSTLKKQTLPKF